MSKKFFYVCCGLLMLVLAYHFGAASATAQVAGNQVVGVAGSGNGNGLFMVMAANGDSYFTPDYGQHWNRYANCFTGTQPTQAQQESWGQVKARYR